MIAGDDTKVFYGTPLAVDDDDEDAPRKKPVPIEQQEVRDERGIRRFHGAFTGGFSAGYFNTVGSKEGWAPANFLSSRETRAEKQSQSRPEDYMDSEDLDVFGIAPRAIKVNKDFDEEKGKGSKSSRKRQFQFNDGPIPGSAPLKDLVVPSRESAGVKLLRKMGWKPGQGIGPRVKRKTKSKVQAKLEDEPSPVRSTQEPAVKVYGCSLPENFSGNEGSDDDDDYELLKGITFAPDDVEVLCYKAKDDFHGIGYKGLDREPILATFRSKNAIAPPPVRDKKKKLAIAGEAFGVGAFEEDDENIYTVDDMSQYDFELGGSSHRKDKKRNKEDELKKGVGFIGEILEGFHLSSKPPAAKKRYPPPVLPKDFQPFYNKTPTKVESTAAEKQKVAVFDRHRLTATERSEIIETEKQVGSVFELMRPEDRARLKAIQKGAPAAPVVIGGPLTTSTVDRRTGRFQPFGRDPDKQKRYELYQKFKEGNKEDVFSKCQPLSMTEWEKQREVEEFRQAAAIYKPLAHSMAMRFTTAKHSDTDIVPAEKPKPSEEAESKPVKELKYGSGTRARVEWHPDRLLCRRFNIPNPYPESTMVGVYKIKRDRFSIFDLLNGNQRRAVDVPSEETLSIELPESPPTHSEEPATSSEVSEVPRKEVKPNLFADLDDIERAPAKTVAPSTSNAAPVEAVPKTDENSEDTRPPMDLFKAIFEDTESENNSEDEDDNAEEEEETKDTEGEKVAEKSKMSVADVIAQLGTTFLDKQAIDKANLGGPRLASGVFANLDLDSPNLAVRSVESSDRQSRRLVSVAVKAVTKPTVTEDSYGPALPPHLISSNSDDMMYGPRLPSTCHGSPNDVQNITPKRHKGKHKHRHKKSSKKKHKSKHKRRENSNSSEESLSESELPVGNVDLNKLLKSRLKSLTKPMKFEVV